MNPWLSPVAILGYVAGAAALVGYVWLYIRCRGWAGIALLFALLITGNMLRLVGIFYPGLAEEVRRAAFGAAEREGGGG